MITLPSIVKTFDVRDIGKCPTCMRISFLAMLLSWLLVWVVFAMDLTRIMHHTTLFCRSCELTRADVPSGGIGVRTLVMQRVGG
jgi:hypothetical protein